MNAHEPSPSFEAARRRQLIEATIETVSEVGFKSASLGEIARRAGVSQGLFAHYFGDKDGLLEATLRFMAARLARATSMRLRAARTPLEKVLAVSESALADEEFERRTSAVWLAFWGQIMHSAPYRRVQSIYQRRMRANLRHGLRPLIPASRVEPAAVLIAATIDGLWLQSHSSEPQPDEAARARETVKDLILILVGSSSAAAPALRAAIEAQREGLARSEEALRTLDTPKNERG
jgi:betaine-aldehyde dehydrogenase